MSPLSRLVAAGFIPVSAAALTFLAGAARICAAGPPQSGSFDPASLPVATEYATEAPKGRGFVGAEAPVLVRSLSRINKALGTDLKPDPRLARLAQWIYERTGPEVRFPSRAELDILTSSLGLPEPLPHLLMTQARDAPRLFTVVSARLARVFDLAEYTHIGGVAERVRGGVVVVIALSRRHITIAPVPAKLAAPGPLPLSGRLDAGYVRPRLIQMLPGGDTRETPLGAGPDFSYPIDLAAPGRHRIEIMADGPRGPEVVVNFPVLVGTTPADGAPAMPAITAPEPPRRAAAADGAQARFVELINQSRALAGLSALAFDVELSAAARGHSDDMRRTKYVAHISPTTGDPEERLLEAGIVTDLAAENVGRGSDPDEIHQGFMESPGHRSAILLPKVTHVGIGVSVEKLGDHTDYIVTELFIRRIPPLGREARLLAMAQIDAGRELDGLGRLEEDPPLSGLAEKAVRDYLGDQAVSQADIMDRLRHALEVSGAVKGTTTAVFVVAGSIEECIEGMKVDPKAWATARRIGFGLVQGTRPGLVPNSIVMVLVFTE
jgi:uncharacterized protein YkwD